MDKKEIQDVTRAYFKSIGFQVLKKTKFYYESGDYFLTVVMLHSNFSKTYYIDYWISLKDLHDWKNTALTDLEVDAQGRFGDTEYAFETEYEKVNPDVYLKVLEKQSKRHIEPIMKYGLTAIAKNSYLDIFDLNVEKYLGKIK